MAKTYKNLYYKIINVENLVIAYKKARKGKTKKDYTKILGKPHISRIFANSDS